MAYRSQKVRVMLGLTRNCPHYSLLGLSIPQASKRTHCISGTIALTAELAQSISILNLRILTTWLIWKTWSSNVRKAEINTSTLCNIVAEWLAHRKTQWIWKEDTSWALKEIRKIHDTRIFDKEPKNQLPRKPHHKQLKIRFPLGKRIERRSRDLNPGGAYRTLLP